MPEDYFLAGQVSVKWGKVDFCSSLEQILGDAELPFSDSLFFSWKLLYPYMLLFFSP